MRITMLMENTACKEGLAFEHGLSLYIETERHKILFDMGQSGAFADNAEAMGIDLKKVDIALLSHGHYDHGGGIRRFLEINDRANVYLSESAFGSRWHGEKYIGLDDSLRESKRLKFVSRQTELSEGLVLRPGAAMTMRRPLSGEGLTVIENGQHVQDDFRHETYLSVYEDGKHVLFSGCSHRGIGNIMEAFAPDVLIGGFHFMKLDPNGEGREGLIEAARELLSYKTKYYTCHCTGEEQYRLMKETMGGALAYFGGGMEIEI